VRRARLKRSRLSLAEARRIALAAQGFDRERPAKPDDARHYRRVLGTLGLVQLDFVNVLQPAHFMVPWSRLGAYDRARFERFVYGNGEYTEQWAHEASVVPASCWPLLAHRRAKWRMHPYNPLRKLKNRRAYLEDVLAAVQSGGALTSAELPPAQGPKPGEGYWNRSLPRWALEYHFARGSLAVARRMPNFQRVYDLPERVLPPAVLSRSVRRADAERELLRCAAGALGVATRQDLADYYRQSPRDVAPRIDELVEEGALQPVAVEGWRDTAYLAADARLPRSIGGACLLSPFDPVVWFRPRAERLFGFHYRIEIYVPATQRRWGYYVLPFRMGDDIVARVDLKADRRGRCLLVLAGYAEEGVDTGGCADSLAAELRALRDWLQLDTVRVTRHNGFSRMLAAAI